MHREVLLVICLLTMPATAAAQSVQSSGYLEVRASHSNSARAWNSGGAGALGSGNGLLAEARVGLNWQNEQSPWRAHVQLLARAQSSDDLGRDAGLLQAFVDYGDLEVDPTRWRIGQAFVGTSQENVEGFWQTPFAISFSTLNSWIGEEFRPIGVEYVRRLTSSTGGQTDLAANVFVGNDTGPAMLAWRGFANHQRLSVYGETLPLLPLPSLTANDQFFQQRDDGSQPFGPDLDQRLGYLLRTKHRFASGGNISLTWVDNRGDRALHDGDEYAWHTQFALLGFQYPINGDWQLLGETMHGRTLMGFPPGANVQFGFNASYLTISRSWDAWVSSLRVEHFHLSEHDRSIGELNTQNGNLVSLALLRNFDDWRMGLEYSYGDITRPGNIEFNGRTQQGGSQVQVLVRRYF